MDYRKALRERVSFVKLGKDIWSHIFTFVVKMQDTSYFVDFRNFDLEYGTEAEYGNIRYGDGCIYDMYDDDNEAASKLCDEAYIRMKKEYTDVITFRLICRFTNKVACSKLRFSINPDFSMHTFHHNTKHEPKKIELETPIRHYPKFSKPTKNTEIQTTPTISTNHRNSHTKTTKTPKVQKNPKLYKKRIRRRGYVSNEFFKKQKKVSAVAVMYPMNF